MANQRPLNLKCTERKRHCSKGMAWPKVSQIKARSTAPRKERYNANPDATHTISAHAWFRGIHSKIKKGEKGLDRVCTGNHRV